MAVAESPVGGWSERWFGWRDRLLADPRFQRWAARFPLTKPIAEKRSRELFDLVAGFVYSQVLLACVRLNLFEELAAGPRRADDLAARLNLSTEAAERLLDAAVSLRLVRRAAGDRYGLGDLGAALRANPGVVAMIEHHHLLYADLADPVALLRRELAEPQLQAYWAYARSGAPAALDDPRVAAYSALMSASQPLVSGDILDAYDFGRHRCLMDVGGGEGAFLQAVAARVPGLDLRLFDLPPVAARAQARFDAAGLGHRARAHGGSFLDDELPQGADVISLVRVVHDHDAAAVQTLLAAVNRALPDDGTLVVAEPMAETKGAEPMGGAYFGFYLWAMGSGRPRSPKSLESLLERAGFTDLRWVPTARPMLTRLLTARPRR
ncbi:MAG: methyltransferase domain-containing protein [Geminicoccaceae bacterium]|nr:MAG: methyltransferase domain-containing protein [Geminicoccaceae bacterium]